MELDSFRVADGEILVLLSDFKVSLVDRTVVFPSVFGVDTTFLPFRANVMFPIEAVGVVSVEVSVMLTKFKVMLVDRGWRSGCDFCCQNHSD